jgi:5'-nucleotidase
MFRNEDRTQGRTFFSGAARGGATIPKQTSVEMRILVSNDDGIYSPGIAALARVASHFGEVRIVAPDVEQSSKSHAITANRPLQMRRTPLVKFDAFRVNGTPADCVALGVSQWSGVDLVLSGVNLGSNVGSAVWHSGTLAAAKQAVLLGIRGIAFSTPVGDDEPDFDKLIPHATEVLQHLLERSSALLLNVNLPTNPRGLLWTRQSIRQYDGKIVSGKDPMGREHFWFTVIPLQESSAGTDRWALSQGYTSITPLRVDLTDDAELSKMHASPGEVAQKPKPEGNVVLQKGVVDAAVAGSRT